MIKRIRIKNSDYHTWSNSLPNIDFICSININDIVCYEKENRIYEGTITYITQKGLGIRTLHGIIFIKYYHIKEIYKNVIDAYTCTNITSTCNDIIRKDDKNGEGAVI